MGKARKKVGGLLGKEKEEEESKPQSKRVKMKYTKILERPKGGTETYSKGFEYNVPYDTYLKLKPYCTIVEE